MVKQIKWSLHAANQLENICEYIASDSEYYASLFAKRILALIENLLTYPRIGRVVPEYNIEELREIIYQNYRIVYRIQKEVIEIVTIVHCARLFKNWSI